MVLSTKMGTGVLLQFPTAPPPPPNLHSFPTKYGGGRTGGSDSNWDNRTTRRRRRRSYKQQRSNYQDYEEEEFGFRNSWGKKKKRSWWSDDDDDDEEESVGGFGIFEGALGFSSFFKVFRAFGWMVPAAIVTMLLGSGTNGFVMSLALPLAQSALSLIFDAVWRNSNERARSKPRRRRKSPFSRGAGNGKSSKERKQYSLSDRKSGAYQSRESANDVSAKTGERSKSFGGWYELDKETPKTSTEPYLS